MNSGYQCQNHQSFYIPSILVESVEDAELANPDALTRLFNEQIARTLLHTLQIDQISLSHSVRGLQHNTGGSDIRFDFQANAIIFELLDTTAR